MRKLKLTPAVQTLEAEMFYLFPDIVMPFSLENGSKFLNNHWTWEGPWQRSFREMMANH